MMNNDLASSSDVEAYDYKFISQDSTDFYEYIQIADDSLETYNVANIPNYVPYFLGLIFALGIIAGLFWGWVSAWKQ